MPALLLLTGPAAGFRVELGAEAVLGRSPACGIPLEDEQVSRRHAKIEWKDGQAHLTDLGSRNGTFLNGQKVEGERVLLPGDQIQVGNTTLVFEPPAQARLSEEESEGLFTQPAEETLPVKGAEGALFRAAAGFITAHSTGRLLQRAVEEAAAGVGADVTAVLLGSSEELRVAAAAGAEQVAVPQGMVRAAMERRESGRSAGRLVAPILCSHGAPFGLLWAERSEPFSEEAELRLAAIGHLLGEAYAAKALSTEVLDFSPVGSSVAFRDRIEQVRRAATGSGPVLFHGEPGVGRAYLAQCLHAQSARIHGPFLAVDCAAGLPQVEEELFGRSTQGELPPRPSVLVRADGGTLLLKNLEALPRTAAERLARYLHRHVAPTRASGEVPVDVRLVASSSVGLHALQAQHGLDSELCRALSGVEIHCPPLRERSDDVPVLFEAFAALAPGASLAEAPSLTPDARRLLCAYSWPGNILELKLLAQRLTLLYAGQAVTALRLPPEIQQGGSPAADLSAATVLGGATLAQLVSRLEKDAISEALREAGGKKIRAAEILGISRPTLDKKIDDFGLVVEKVRKAR